MENMENFFDISKGKCLGVCSCSLEDQVSPSWKQFLEDHGSARGEADSSFFEQQKALPTWSNSKRGGGQKKEV